MSHAGSDHSQIMQTTGWDRNGGSVVFRFKHARQGRSPKQKCLEYLPPPPFLFLNCFADFINISIFSLFLLKKIISPVNSQTYNTIATPFALVVRSLFPLYFIFNCENPENRDVESTYDHELSNV